MGRMMGRMMSGGWGKVCVVAGEASGDELGGGVAGELRERGVEVVGIGGERVEAATGSGSPIPMDEIAVMGFSEVVTSIPRIRRHIQTACRWIEEELRPSEEKGKPTAVVAVDAKGFNLRVARMVAKRGRVHPSWIGYVAPSLWAYADQGKVARAAQGLEAGLDGLISVNPLDGPVLAQHAPHLRTTYVGFPAAAGIEPPPQPRHYLDERPDVYTPQYPLRIGVFPGSRKMEVSALLPVFARVVHGVQARLGLEEGALVASVHASSPSAMSWAASTLPVGRWKGVTWEMSALPARQSMASGSGFHVALAASGSVVVQLSASQTPTVVAYPGSWLTKAIVSRTLRIRHASLPNLMAVSKGREVGVGRDALIPEFLFDDASDCDGMVARVCDLLGDRGARDRQRGLFPAGGAAAGGAARDAARDAADFVMSVMGRGGL